MTRNDAGAGDLQPSGDPTVWRICAPVPGVAEEGARPVSLTRVS